MENFTNKRVACSGGAGFVGSNFIKYLNSKGVSNIDIYDKIDSLPSKLHNILPLNFRSIEPHDTLLERLYEYDWVILLGANSATKTKPEDYRKVLEDNFYSTREILRKFANGSNLRKLVFSSSASTYGLSEDFTERTENIAPQHLYGLSKLLVDREIERLIDLPHKPQIFSFRFFNCTGSDEKHKIAKGMSSPISKFLNQDPPYILFRDDRGTKFSRDFIHVNDISQVVYHALTTEFPAGLYNLGSGQDTTWEELVKLVCEVKGEDYDKCVQYQPIPPELASQYQSFSRADVTKLRQYYKEPFMSVREMVEKTWADIKKSK
jgi:ADP-L-glycero-D-manno-heptose 6-epimerase